MTGATVNIRGHPSGMQAPGLVVPILTYHSIFAGANTSWRGYTVAPSLFDEHLSFLRAAGYQTITVDQFSRALIDALPVPPRPLILTFDDGHLDFLSNALPRLARHQMVATLYVATGLVGRCSPWRHRVGEDALPMVSWDEVRAVAQEGVEIGAHAVTHRQLDTLPRSEAWTEICASKAALEDHTGREVSTFCYPYGCSDATVRQMVRDAGYIGACSTTPALSNATDDRFRLARVPIMAGTSVADLEVLLQRLPLAPVPERSKTKLWRLARRQTAAARRLVPFLSGSRV